MNNKNIEEQIKEAVRKDFHKLYVKQFTTGWKEQRFLRDIEIGVMSFDSLTNLIQAEKEQYLDEFVEWLEIDRNYGSSPIRDINRELEQFKKESNE